MSSLKMARYERSLWVDEAAKLAASKHSVKLLELVANEMIRDENELGTLKLIGWRNIGRVDETKVGEGCVSLSQLGDGNHRLHFAMKAHFIEFQPSRPHRARLTLPPSPRKTGRGGLFAQVHESAYQVEFEPSCLQAVLCCKGRASSQKLEHKYRAERESEAVYAVLKTAGNVFSADATFEDAAKTVGKLSASSASAEDVEPPDCCCCHWNLCPCCPIVCCEIPRATDPSGSTPRSPPPSP